MRLSRQTITSIVTVILILLSASVYAQSEDSLNDAEIADIAVTANQIDIDYAEIALERSRNDEVRNFAETMIRDHNAVIEQAVELVTELGVTPMENDLSSQLKEDAGDTKVMLRDKNRRSFDEVYIENEIAYHEAVIDVVRDVLIPQATNPELKELLESVLPSLQAHLDHANMVKDEITQSTGAY